LEKEYLSAMMIANPLLHQSKGISRSPIHFRWQTILPILG